MKKKTFNLSIKYWNNQWKKRFYIDNGIKISIKKPFNKSIITKIFLYSIDTINASIVYTARSIFIS